MPIFQFVFDLFFKVALHTAIILDIGIYILYMFLFDLEAQNASVFRVQD